MDQGTVFGFGHLKWIDRGNRIVLGGFHLAGFQSGEIQEVIDMLNALKIQKIGPCHCTGDKALRMFADEYAENFIKAGAGKEIVVS